MNTSPTIILNRSRRLVWCEPGPFRLPIVIPERLKQLYRDWADLPPDESLLGIDPDVISLAGYKVCRTGYSGVIDVPRGAIVIPVRAPSGQIVALHDENLKWFTAPKVHTAKLARKLWTNTIEIFENTIEADAAANLRNVAAVALNGFDFKQLSQNLVGQSPNIVTKLEAAA